RAPASPRSRRWTWPRQTPLPAFSLRDSRIPSPGRRAWASPRSRPASLRSRDYTARVHDRKVGEDSMNYRIISADDHIHLQWMPRDVWQKRVPSEWRERAPKVVDTTDGPTWVCGDDKWEQWGGRAGAAGARSGRRTAIDRGGVFEHGVLRPTTTALRLADMARDGVDATVMYGPIVPLLIKDPELRRVCYRGYNDWLAEF